MVRRYVESLNSGDIDTAIGLRCQAARVDSTQRPRLEDARLALRERGAAPGLQDELATVIRVLHGKLGLDEGGVL